jgi:acylphosphatase
MGAQRRHVIVTGHVHNVWFRDSCRAEAQARGVRGWVANRPDGSVEAVFEGPADAVEALVAWCRHGPPRARVDGVQVTPEPVRGEAGFAVR